MLLHIDNTMLLHCCCCCYPKLLFRLYFPGLTVVIVSVLAGCTLICKLQRVQICTARFVVRASLQVSRTHHTSTQTAPLVVHKSWHFLQICSPLFQRHKLIHSHVTVYLSDLLRLFPSPDHDMIFAVDWALKTQLFIYRIPSLQY